MKDPVMNGQEQWSSGNELRFVVGSPETGPARVFGSNGELKFSGTFAEAVRWLRSAACRPLYEAW